MPTADFSNQAYVEDDRKDRMVLSDFAGADFGDGADFGYSELSYGGHDSFSYGEQVSNHAAPGEVTTYEKEILRAMGKYHKGLHQRDRHSAMGEHPLLGTCGSFEGQMGLLPSINLSKIVSDLTKTVTTTAQKAGDQAITGAKTAVASQLTQAASNIIADPNVKRFAEEQAKKTASQVVADKILQTANVVQEKAGQVAQVVKENKTPLILAGVGGLLALYFLMRRK